jgi:hypothetical protein
MADPSPDLLQQYDELVDVVTNSTSDLYQENLARLFSLIDGTPKFASVTSRLEALSDFEAWFTDLHNRRKSLDLDATPLNLPVNQDAALGIQITLFRRMAKGTIHPALFAQAYLSSDRNLDANVRELSQQLFSPMARGLRRNLIESEQLLTQVLEDAECTLRSLR